MIASNLNHPNLMGKLLDNYLGTTTPVALNGRTNYSFSVTTDSGSFKADRFKLIFYQSGALPVNGIVLTAEGRETQAIIEWNTENQINIDHYEIERSYDGIHFIDVSRQLAIGSNGQSIGYSWLDEQAIKGNNYYRIKAVGKNGEFTYSNIVMVKLGKEKNGISVFPTLVHDGKVNVLLTDMPKGNYSVRCIAENGSVIASQWWSHDGGSMLRAIDLNTKTIGNYHIEIKGDNKYKIVKTVLVAK